MLTYPEINPVLFELGVIKIRWYGLAYLLGFVAAWWLARYRARRREDWNNEQVGDLVFYMALGVILGGRIGYVLLYDFSSFIANPLMIFKIWEGGMSFHGGLLGTLLAMWLLARKQSRRFFAVADFIAPMVPVGLGAGRIANFINSELWGGPGQVPWAMRVPCEDLSAERAAQFCAEGASYSVPLHPSQLYEAVLEGLVLFIILWWFSSRARPLMAVSGLFLFFYGVFRFAVEFVRQPDDHLGYLAWDWLTMGQVLSLPMILVGALLVVLAYSRNDNALHTGDKHEGLS